MRITVDELDVFKLSGPTYLVESGQTWTHANSLRAVMACLVQAVYALEKDRSSVLKMQLAPLAPDWYLPFKYKLVKTLKDSEGSEQIVGAVFKWSRRLSLLREGIAPKIVIAFRGTLPFGDTLRSDLMADLDVIMLQLHKTPRYLVALEEAEQAVARYGAGRVCLTGHSLGAAVCLLVDRTLALKDCFVDAHLFSPPFPSLEHFCSLKAMVAALAASFASDKANVDRSTRGGDSPGKDVSTIHDQHLKKWQPHMYVNMNDPICTAYVDYFRLRELEHANAKQNGDSQGLRRGFRSLMQSLVGREAIPFYLIPCARLYYTDAVKGFKKAHGMKQWWSPETPPIKTQFIGLAAAA